MKLLKIVKKHPLLLLLALAVIAVMAALLFKKEGMVRWHDPNKRPLVVVNKRPKYDFTLKKSAWFRKRFTPLNSIYYTRGPDGMTTFQRAWDQQERISVGVSADKYDRYWINGDSLWTWAGKKINSPISGVTTS